ncbi:MAG: MATE family efflux transporter [Pseudomonadota bacterium]
MEVKDTKTDIVNLIKFAWPFILANISYYILQVTDRIMISWYNQQAAVEINTIFRSLVFILLTPKILLSITSMLSGKYNGAGQYHLTTKPIWQGIWMASVLGTIIFIIAHTDILKYILPQNCETYGLAYGTIIIQNAILMYISSILSGFFYSIGEGYIVNYSVWIVNITNIILNYIMIFKLDLGTEGAAYATVIANALQIIILFTKFFQLDSKYNALYMHFDLNEMKKIIKLGLPSASGHGLEMLAWHYIGILIASFGLNTNYMKQLFFTSICQIPFRIIRCSIEKSVAAVSANIIGAKKPQLVPEIISSTYKIFFVMMCAISIGGIIFLDQILYIFNFTNISPELYNTILETTILSGFVMFFTGMASIYSSILTILHDTTFIMKANTISVWGFCIVPVMLWSYMVEFPPYNFTLYATLSYGIVYYATLYIRYRYYHLKDFHANKN